MKNEFIVWDKEHKRWLESYYNHILYVPLQKDNDRLIRVDYDDVSEAGYVYITWDENEVDIFQKVMDDKDGNPIYANSSIVEFDDWNELYSRVDKRKGYFIFDKNTLQYVVVFTTGPTRKYNTLNMSNFKVIDTVQENSLGLVKDE